MSEDIKLPRDENGVPIWPKDWTPGQKLKYLWREAGSPRSTFFDPENVEKRRLKREAWKNSKKDDLT